jgi:hypothetical protein
MARGDPAGEVPSEVQRTADADTLTERVASLHAQADAVTATRPRLQNALVAATHGAGTVAASDLRTIGDAGDFEIAGCREEIERLATALARASGTHTRGTAPPSGDLFQGDVRVEALGPERAPSFEHVARLVADVSTDLPGDGGDRCRARLPRATDAELTLLADLVATGLTHDQLVRFLEGGHLLLPGHRLLKQWRSLPGVTPRTSSHYHPDDRRRGRGPAWLERARARLADAHAHPVYGQQYGLKGRFVHEALFGPGPHRTTFIQLERAAPSKLRLVQHVADWVRYRLTHRNQGPYGSSLDTDAKPMRGIVWWKPAKRSDRSVQLQQIAEETDRIVRELLDVAAQLDAQGRLRSIVWRGPSSNDFDAAVDHAIDELKRAAAAVGAFSARVRREERST